MHLLGVRPSVCRSVCPVMGHGSKPAAAANLQVCCRPEGLLLWPGLQEISIDCCTARWQCRRRKMNTDALFLLLLLLLLLNDDYEVHIIHD